MTEPDQDDAARHRAKMEKRKAVQDAEVASKTITQRGLLMVHTGPGKGKSTAAFGLALRMVGTGRNVAVIQFIKGAWQTGERAVLEGFGPQVRWYAMGEGFTWETQDRARDVAACRRAWDRAVELMADPDLSLLVLDELAVAMRYDYLTEDEVLTALRARPAALHVVVTGRNAKPSLIEAADLVTEMQLVKHHFAAGVRAQIGIEFLADAARDHAARHRVQRWQVGAVGRAGAGLRAARPDRAPVQAAEHVQQRRRDGGWRRDRPGAGVAGAPPAVLRQACI